MTHAFTMPRHRADELYLLYFVEDALTYAPAFAADQACVVAVE